jgi:hypothetical protein
VGNRVSCRLLGWEGWRFQLSKQGVWKELCIAGGRDVGIWCQRVGWSLAILSAVGPWIDGLCRGEIHDFVAGGGECGNR